MAFVPVRAIIGKQYVWEVLMRTAKLTLTADRELIRRAKKFAAQNGTSVSALFSKLLSAMTHAREIPGIPGPLTRRASGLIRLSNTAKDDQLLKDALSQKYGLEK
jgi:hypothetical protein